jgi:hypothetical protein
MVPLYSRARHAATFFRALPACIRAAAAVVMLVLGAFGGAQFTKLGT